MLPTWALDITPGLLERGVAIEDGLDRPLLFHDSPRFISAVRLVPQDELDRCRDVSEALSATRWRAATSTRAHGWSCC